MNASVSHLQCRWYTIQGAFAFGWNSYLATCIRSHMIPFKKTGSLEIPLPTDGQVLLLGSGVSYPCRQKQQTTVGCCVEPTRNEYIAISFWPHESLFGSSMQRMWVFGFQSVRCWPESRDLKCTWDRGHSLTIEYLVSVLTCCFFSRLINLRCSSVYWYLVSAPFTPAAKQMIAMRGLQCIKDTPWIERVFQAAGDALQSRAIATILSWNEAWGRQSESMAREAWADLGLVDWVKLPDGSML